jgi:hypothetical protein
MEAVFAPAFSFGGWFVFFLAACFVFIFVSVALAAPWGLAVAGCGGGACGSRAGWATAAAAAVGRCVGPWLRRAVVHLFFFFFFFVFFFL